ncbi:MAG TPA: DUF6264 family protein [Pseudolysinimonas sp.]|nr:DUF6264 family protein [Pseudolysinimonas sp.]
MPDPRPVPRYGEYATPEEVAALRGTDLPARAISEPPPTVRRSTLRRLDRPITIALIAFGVLNLLQYASVLLDFEAFLEVATKGTPAESIDFTEIARIGGVVLFVLCLALVLASAAVAVFLLRRRRVAFWVPLVGGALSVVAWVAVLLVILLQTPGALLSTGS